MIRELKTRWTCRWRGKRITRTRYSVLIICEPQRFFYFSAACDPLDFGVVPLPPTGEGEA